MNETDIMDNKGPLIDSQVVLYTPMKSGRVHAVDEDGEISNRDGANT